MLYVRNLTQDCSEEKLKESFEQYGKIERVKKIKDYAFIHFEDRDNAVKVNNILITIGFNLCQTNDCVTRTHVKSYMIVLEIYIFFFF